MRRGWVGLMSLLLMVALSGCSRTAVGSCSTEKVLDYGERIGRQLERYDAQLQLAGSTGRINLSGPRQALIDVRFATMEIEHPPCLDDFHARVLTAMEAYERGYNYFMLELDTLSSNTIDQAATEMGYVRQNLLMIQQDIIPIYE